MVVLWTISWFKRQSLTFMILKYRFNSFSEASFVLDLMQYLWELSIDHFLFQSYMTNTYVTSFHWFILVFTLLIKSYAWFSDLTQVKSLFVMVSQALDLDLNIFCAPIIALSFGFLCDL